MSLTSGGHFLTLALIIVASLNISYADTVNAFVSLPDELFPGQINKISIFTSNPIKLVKTKLQLCSTYNRYSSKNETERKELQSMSYVESRIHQTLVGVGENIAQVPLVVPFLPDTDSSISATLFLTIEECFSSNECSSTVERKIEAHAEIRRHPIIILGETDKPIYRPGETIKARFLTLSGKLLYPNIERTTHLPTKRVYRDASYKCQATDLKSNSGIDAPILYKEIYIHDHENELIKQWLNATPLEAARLEFTIPPNAPEGTWSMLAKVGQSTHSLNFVVKNYVLPRFTFSISESSKIQMNRQWSYMDGTVVDAKVTEHHSYSVCAHYTDGPPMSGKVRSLLCACDTYSSGADSGLSSSEAEKVLSSQTCSSERSNNRMARPCVLSEAILSSDGCARFNVSTEGLHLSNSKYRSWGLSTLLCAEVTESGTDSAVRKCEFGSKIEYSRASVELKLPSVMKPGLPLSGSVKVSDSDVTNLGNFRVLITVYNRTSPCMWYGGSRGQVLRNVSVTLNPIGIARLYLPPVFAPFGVSVVASYSKSGRQAVSQRTRRRIAYPPFVRPPNNPDVVTTEKTVSAWPNDVSMQLWSDCPQLDSISCPGKVRLSLLANVPLMNRTMFVETVVRGLRLRVVIPALGVAEKCEDQDGELGHYKCLSRSDDVTAIECLEGWKGTDCLQPTCSSNCHEVGGFCNLQGECNCRVGWKGELCDECVVRKDCENGVCKLGNDCECKPGWTGYNCKRREVIREDVPQPAGHHEPPTLVEPPTPHRSRKIYDGIEVKRTLYQRQIEFDIGAGWGPEATAVLYFRDPSAYPAPLISVSVKLSNLSSCTTPAITVSDGVTDFQFGRASATAFPGENVLIRIAPKALKASSSPYDLDSELSSSQVCFSRVSDVSLDNFALGSPALTFDKIIDAFEQRGSGYGKWRPIEPTSTSQTFSAAGLKTASDLVDFIDEPVHACPMYRAQTARLGVNGPPDAVEYDSEPVGATSSQPPTRIRDYFPEIWQFDVDPVKPLNASQFMGVSKQLTAPDTITTWRASAYCTTSGNGLWVGRPRLLTVSMPFFVQVTLPVELKRNEVLHLPINVFLQTDEELCGKYELKVDVDPSEWLLTGADQLTGCVCSNKKQTVSVGLIAQQLGQLNVTIHASLQLKDPFCSSESSKSELTTTKLSDAVRRAIRVVPEGFINQASQGSVICLPASGELNQANETLAIELPPNIVPGSLQTYVSYSDQVLGRALANLDKLVRLPVGCGEQNMVLVAPNVYILDYLKSTGLASHLDTKDYNQLVQSSKSFIESGYRNQLKYQHEDGSFSAFGSRSDRNGSTWLTAFTLQVFARARNVEPNFNIDWDTLINSTVGFLEKCQSEISGCFEENGKVLHSGMQGSLGGVSKNGNNFLLTAYVMSALSELNQSTSPSQVGSMITQGSRCLVDSINVTTLAKLPTYVLAQVAYTLTKATPQSPNVPLRSVLQHELLSRQRHSEQSRGMEVHFWLSTDHDSDKYVSADLETTAYAYLTSSMQESFDPIRDGLPTIRWLTRQQSPSGGFMSTQDTVLGLNAITDFSKRLGLASAKGGEPADVIKHLVSVGETEINVESTRDQRRVINQIPIAIEEQSGIHVFHWQLSSPDPSGTGCMAVQVSAQYNLPDSSQAETDYFKLSVSVDQSELPSLDSCKKASLSICLSPAQPSSSDQTTGMLLASIGMVTGWEPDAEKLDQALDDLVKKIEFDDNKLSVYFDGFSSSDRTPRCLTVPLVQQIYTENAQKASIHAFDYYSTERSIEVEYKLNECRREWEVIDRPVPDKPDPTTTPSPITTTASPVPEVPHCPVCELTSEKQEANLGGQLADSICKQSNTIYMLTTTNTTEIDVAYLSQYGSIARWITELNLSSVRDQSCCPEANLPIPSESQEKKHFFFLSTWPLKIYPGDPQLELTSTNASASLYLLPVNAVLPRLKRAALVWLPEIASFTEREKNGSLIGFDWQKRREVTGCRRLSQWVRYLTVKLGLP